MSADSKSSKNTPASTNGAKPNGAARVVEGTILPVIGSLDRALDHVDKALAGGANLILDFSECTFVTVEGLEWLEELLLRAQSLRLEVHIVKVQPTIYKVFKVAHIGSILKACDSPAPRGPVC
ncbi:MAG TPA: STAS domain-containing protein [Oculatellaceae cyanobacterium]